MPRVFSANFDGPDAVLHESASLNFGALADGAREELTVTVPGAAVGDGATANPRTQLEAGLAIGAVRVSAANTVSIQLVCFLAAGVDAAANTYDVYVTKAERG